MDSCAVFYFPHFRFFNLTCFLTMNITSHTCEVLNSFVYHSSGSFSYSSTNIFFVETVIQVDETFLSLLLISWNFRYSFASKAWNGECLFVLFLLALDLVFPRTMPVELEYTRRWLSTYCSYWFFVVLVHRYILHP